MEQQFEKQTTASPETGPKPEGIYYLELLELDHLANQQIPGYGIPVKDFLDICGDHARPMLVGLDSLERGDPKFESSLVMLQGFIKQFVQPTEQ